jgi:DNA-binding GntR family transcriptional regulator
MSIPATTPAPDFPAGATPLGGRKADRAHDLLKRAILLRRHAPGAHLLQQGLAAEFGCAQGTVREALLALEEDGLVERRGYRGAVVTETSRAEAVALVRVRLSIERGVARRLARDGLARPGAGEALDRILAAMDAAHAAGDLYRCSELDRAFHATRAQAAGMDLLSPILRRCALHIHRFTLGGVEVPRHFFQESGLGDEHRALLAAMLDGPPDAASQAAADHLARVLLRWAPSLHDAAGPEAFRRDHEGGAEADALHDET